MDDDHEDRPQRPKRTDDRGRPFVDGAPRGRGLGKPTAVVFKCAVCGTELHDLLIEFDTPCPSCGKPLRCCTNCTFFDTSARLECRKPITERVESKAKANRCTFFQPKQVRDLKVKAESSPKDPRAAFDALFKK
jgi:hypothetical protein